MRWLRYHFYCLCHLQIRSNSHRMKINFMLLKTEKHTCDAPRDASNSRHQSNWHHRILHFLTFTKTCERKIDTLKFIHKHLELTRPPDTGAHHETMSASWKSITCYRMWIVRAMRNLKHTRMTLMYMNNSRIQTSILCFEKIELEIDLRGRRGVAEGLECVGAETEGCRGAAETGATGIAAVMAIFLKNSSPKLPSRNECARGSHCPCSSPQLRSSRNGLDAAAIAHHSRIFFDQNLSLRSHQCEEFLYPLPTWCPRVLGLVPGLDNRLELVIFPYPIWTWTEPEKYGW